MNSIIYRNFKYHNLISWTRNAAKVQAMARLYSASSNPVEPLKPKFVSVYDKFDNLTHLYKFPYMGAASFISNLKIYFLPALTVATILIHAESELDEESIKVMFLIYLLTLGQATLFSIPVLNFVGHIYVNPKLEVVLSFLNGYGNRVDKIFPAGDLVIQSRETGLFRFITKDSFYVFLVSKSTGRKFRLNLKHGELFDEDVFRECFGEIPADACH